MSGRGEQMPVIDIHDNFELQAEEPERDVV
jgi:hypothetical protein